MDGLARDYLSEVKFHPITISRNPLTAVFLAPIVLAILCGIGLFTAREPKRQEPKIMTRMPWLDEAIAYASEPLFSEERDEQQIS